MSVPAKESATTLSQARGFADRARDEVQALVDGFRAKSKFVQWKAYIVAAYVVLLVATLVVALWDSNPLSAEIRIVKQPGLGGGHALSLHNASDDNWTDVQLVLNGIYRYKATIPTVRPGESKPILIRDFEQVDSTNHRVAAPKSLVPTTLAIQCEEGSVEMEFDAP